MSIDQTNNASISQKKLKNKESDYFEQELTSRAEK